MLAVLTILITVFELWWAIAYFYAYRQIGERMLLLQVVQAGAIGLLFAYITFVLLGNQEVNGLIAGLLLLTALAVAVYWRMQGGIKLLLQRYPRGMVDVLSFRRPAVDLKRRVRTK